MPSERLYVGGGGEGKSSAADSVAAGGVPDDLAVQASKRVAALALIIVIASLWALFKGKVLQHGAAGELREPAYWGIAIALAASLAMGIVAWRTLLPPRTVLRIGLGYEILLCTVLDLAQNTAGYPDNAIIIGLPGTCGIILIAPLLVPVPWKLRLGTTTACAVAFPITLFLAEMLGTPRPSPSNVVLLMGSVIVSAALALIAARIVSLLSEEVTKARKAVKDMGSYHMVEELGRGGMGEVWRAEHRMLARPAAIKIIRADNLRESNAERRRVALTRFEREAQATAALTSPHTVQVFDFGLTDDGAFYYVMELLDGLDLMQIIKKDGAMPVARAVFLVKQVCESLAEAHAAGLVHRDLKPNNIMACRVGGRHDFAKVLDFGLVQQTNWETDSDEAGRLTVDGALLGTPAFMPPEMAMGRTDVDARADVYGLGCLLYWLTVGRPPFMGETAMATILMHVQETPPRIGEMVEVPRELDAIVASCMQKDPAQRPEDAGALLALLETVELPTVWDEARAKQWWSEQT
jgi:tRNA A-37 threonylcarbamoyl transferase component Bud32